jgi:putative ABC transport system substrate-binding protein
MRRREFLALASGVAVTWPFPARTQQLAMPVVGYLNARSAESDARFTTAFREGLKKTGYLEGRNVAIEYRWGDGQYDRLPALATDLVQHKVSVIAATTTPAALAAKAATTTIPIVFETAADPVQLGLVANLHRPGGNITGVTQLNIETTPKRLELLHELLPKASVIALLVNPANPPLAEAVTAQAVSAAQTLGLKLHVLNAKTESDFDGVFANMMQLRADGLVIGADAFLADRSELLAALAARHGVPAVYETRAFAAAGGLASYGGSIIDAYDLTGAYVARVLKGERPSELPILQATKVELFLNLKTAQTLGITIPLPLLGRADEVME